MDIEGIFYQFDNIEGKVEKLIEVCKSLEAKNSDLKEQILKLEGELKRKTESEELNRKQKSLVQSKIDSLITKIDNFAEFERL